MPEEGERAVAFVLQRQATVIGSINAPPTPSNLREGVANALIIISKKTVIICIFCKTMAFVFLLH